MNMFVTAEGVETDAQAALARTAGCDQMQGWLYYKAIPADEITRHLANAKTARDDTGDDYGHVAHA
jgi:EAL domain-containing protein (putative c-di-GMP-specific phosphodiesterase class I)